MYKALIEIGGYGKGEEVPKEIAEVWEAMYVVSPVEKVSSSKPETKQVEKPVKTAVNPMLDDYLARNESVVKKNIKKDNLSKEDVSALIVLEKSGKNRRSVLKLLSNKW